MPEHKENYIVRNAVLEDAQEIASVSASVAFDKNHLNEESGFIVHPLSKKDVAVRIKNNVFFEVVVSDNKILGYLLAYDRNHIQQLQESNILDHEDEVIDALNNEPEPFVYVEQIAIKKGFHGQGLGRRLLVTFLEKKKKSYLHVWTVVVLEPIKNERSIRFFTRNGFKLVKKISVKKGKYLVGLYSLSL